MRSMKIELYNNKWLQPLRSSVLTSSFIDDQPPSELDFIAFIPHVLARSFPPKDASNTCNPTVMPTHHSWHTYCVCTYQFHYNHRRRFTPTHYFTPKILYHHHPIDQHKSSLSNKPPSTPCSVGGSWLECASMHRWKWTPTSHYLDCIIVKHSTDCNQSDKLSWWWPN